MHYEIKGGSFPVVELTLNKGIKVISESGAMCWKDDSISMDTTSDGGFGKVLGRMVSGEKLFHNIYMANQDNSRISFGSCVPGAIKAVQISAGQCLICQKSAFLLAVGNVDISVHFNKNVGVGLFGGEGFVMQKIQGEGIVFLEIAGSELEYELQANQKMAISTGHLVSITESCQLDVETVKGIKNVFLGGEGLFNTIVTGPGRVVVQTMPLAKLAKCIAPYIKVYNNNTSNNNNSNHLSNLSNLYKK